MTYIELVRAAAKVIGIDEPISDSEADYILWEYTGFPEFFRDNIDLERQLLAFMRTWRDTGKWPKHPLAP